MQQLAVVSASQSWPAHWALREFQVHHHASLDELDASVRYRCVLLVEPPLDELDDLVESLKERDRLGAVATLVVGRAQSPGVHALLAQYPCDGFLDLDWPETLAAAGLRIALEHVALGRNMIEIQRMVIDPSRQQLSALDALSNGDGLTADFAQRHFAELMERQHARSVRRGQSYALVFIDLDDLRQRETEHGPEGSSRAVNELAGAIALSVRTTDVAMRLGGDEFAVILSDCDQASGIDFANRLCSKVRQHAMTVSCGVASYPADGAVSSELLDHADAALAHAKATGKNRAVGFAPSLHPTLTH